jgi:DNA mismatch endonuclease (patch repair protein)
MRKKWQCDFEYKKRMLKTLAEAQATDEFKNKVRAATQSPERNRKIGLASKQHWQTPEYRAKLVTPEKAEMNRINGRKFQHHDEETKERISNTMRNILTNPTMREEYSSRVRAVARLGGIAAILQMPKQDTQIEIALQKALGDRATPFEVHTNCENISIPDIRLVGTKILIFADGDFWHGCPMHFPNPNKWQLRTMIKDRKQTATLTQLGYTVLRFWEHAIISNLEQCVQTIVSNYEPVKPQIFKEVIAIV